MFLSFRRLVLGRLQGFVHGGGDLGEGAVRQSLGARLGADFIGRGITGLAGRVGGAGGGARRRRGRCFRLRLSKLDGLVGGVRRLLGRGDRVFGVG